MAETQGRDYDHDGSCDRGTFLEALEDLIGENIIVIVKSGGNCSGAGCCCANDGTLCSIGYDFILLINTFDGIVEKTIIPISAIAAVRRESC